MAPSYACRLDVAEGLAGTGFRAAAEVYDPLGPASPITRFLNPCRRFHWMIIYCLDRYVLVTAVVVGPTRPPPTATRFLL